MLLHRLLSLNIHAANVFLSTWWVHCSFIYCALLKLDKVTTGRTVSNLFDAIEPSTSQKRPKYETRPIEMTLYQDNAWPHNANPMKACLKCSNKRFALLYISRYCAVQLFLLPLDDTKSGQSTVLLI